MKFADGNFYLRRSTDPVTTGGPHADIRYCKKSSRLANEPPPCSDYAGYGAWVKGLRGCGGTCLNGNIGYPDLSSAIAACDNNPECGGVNRHGNTLYYLRRSIVDDPLVVGSDGPDSKAWFCEKQCYYTNSCGAPAPAPAPTPAPAPAPAPPNNTSPPTDTPACVATAVFKLSYTSAGNGLCPALSRQQ